MTEITSKIFQMKIGLQVSSFRVNFQFENWRMQLGVSESLIIKINHKEKAFLDFSDYQYSKKWNKLDSFPIE